MTTWIIPCNIKYYDIFGAFSKLKKLDWRQSTKVEAGDIVYVYVARPYSAIMYKCKANKVDLTFAQPDIDDSEFSKESSEPGHHDLYMELELMEAFPQDRYRLETLRECGFRGSFQGPVRAPEQIQRLLEP